MKCWSPLKTVRLQRLGTWIAWIFISPIPVCSKVFLGASWLSGPGLLCRYLRTVVPGQQWRTQTYRRRDCSASFVGRLHQWDGDLSSKSSPRCWDSVSRNNEKDANPFCSVFHPTFTFCQCQHAVIMGDAAATNPGPEGSVVHAFCFAEVYFLHCHLENESPFCRI